MFSSLSSARRLAASALGASAVAGAMLFGATPAANAAPAPAPQSVGFAHVAPAGWHPAPVRGGGRATAASAGAMVVGDAAAAGVTVVGATAASAGAMVVGDAAGAGATAAGGEPHPPGGCRLASPLEQTKLAPEETRSTPI